MASIWHTVATRDARLLRMQLDTVAGLPKEYIFLNYLRCHDDIGWGLDYGYLSQFGIEEVAHKRYLNDYFLGNAGYSNSRGETYNDDPATGDARMCGTTASLCGIEKAGYEGVQLHGCHSYLINDFASAINQRTVSTAEAQRTAPASGVRSLPESGKPAVMTSSSLCGFPAAIRPWKRASGLQNTM